MSRGLSKSKLMSFLQCPKKLWLEVHRPELAEPDPEAEARFADGHEVGEIARRLYDDGAGVLIEYDKDMTVPLAHTAEALGQKSTAPIFEATVERDGLLVRGDILLRGDAATRLVEVKASTSVKPEHLDDCAIQSWVFETSPARPHSVALAHINNQFVYQGDDNYKGLLVEKDVTAETAPKSAHVPVALEAAKKILAGAEPDATIGTRCWTPYDCPFQRHCWKETAYPLTGLPAINSQLNGLLADGHYDVRHLPEGLLRNDGQRRVWRAVRSGRAELLPGARLALSALAYPRYYLDFETTGFAVPRWADTRPYQSIPFQWSLHIEGRDGSLEHRQFLDLSGGMPARPLAEALLDATARDGPIFMYTAFERRCIEDLATLCPDLRKKLAALADRLVDLKPIAKDHYYHPDMHGSWSIKAILPTIAPELDYASLSGIADGLAAQRAYAEATSRHTDSKRVAVIRSELLKYCEHDTLAMVRLARYLAAGDTPVAPTV